MLELTRLAKTIQDYDQILTRKNKPLQEKDTEDKPKDYLLGIDSRLQEVFRAKWEVRAMPWRNDRTRYLQWYYREWHRS